MDQYSYKIVKYYDQSLVNSNSKISFDEASNEFLKLFTRAVSLRLRSDVKIGSCLSGGLDSSSIITVAKGVFSNNFTANTISSCYHDSKFDEQEYIDVVTKHTGYNAIKIFPDLNDLLEKNVLELINYHQDQPIPGATHFSEYSVFEAAKKNKLIVMLDGQGADEFLAGYIPFPIYNYSLIRNKRFIKLCKELYFQNINHFKWFQFIYYNICLVKNRLLFQLSNKNVLPHWINEHAINGIDFLKHVNQHKFASYRELSLHEIQYSSLPYQLHSEDRNSMLHSVESRLPFLDFELTDFMFSLPDDFKIKDGTTKAVLRQALKEYLPEKIRRRHSKLGFAAPDMPFIRENKKKVRLLLDNAIESSNGLLNPTLLEDFDKMNKGSIKYDQAFFRVISFYFWSKVFNVSM